MPSSGDTPASVILGEIYRLIAWKNQENGKSNAWADAETNMIWTIGEENVLLCYYADNVGEMSEQEIRDFITLTNSQVEKDERWDDTANPEKPE